MVLATLRFFLKAINHDQVKVFGQRSNWYYNIIMMKIMVRRG